MRYRIMASLLFLLPFFALAQTSPNWYLYLNKTKLLTAPVDSTASVQLSKGSKGSLKICFPARDKAYKRSVVLMDEQRQTILQKDMKTTLRMASFPMADVLLKSNKQPFVIYIVDIPADPAKAMLVRMAPVAICKVNWK